MPPIVKGLPIVTARSVKNSCLNFDEGHLATREAFTE